MIQHKKALITGCNGFVGGWLSGFLINQGYEVCGIDIQNEARHKGCGTYYHGDVTNGPEVAAWVTDFKPDVIYHLAGVSYLPQADHSPKQSIDINISGTLSVLDAVKNISPATKVLLVGSSKEYDSAITSDGIAETVYPQPTNFYGITKYASELFGLQYRRQFGIDVRCTRSFNHTGPGQSPNFVCSDWARQIALISLGRAEPVITVGELGATIDFADVRDVIAAYFAILERGRPGEVYNVCSGNGVSLTWILDYLCGKATTTVSVHYTDQKIRNHRFNIKMIGSNTKLTDHTGWKPLIPFQQTLDDLYAWWVGELEKRESE